MNSQICSIFVSGLLLLVPMVSLGQSVSDKCIEDLKFIPEFLLENDAGGKDAIIRKSQDVMELALENALRKAIEVNALADCEAVIKDYLSNWRQGHIDVRTIMDRRSPTPTNNPIGNDKNPTIEYLSRDTVLLNIPSFQPKYRESLASILESNKSELEKHSNWIIDIRQNGGGSDSTYAPLLKWVMKNQWTQIDTTFLSTPVNIKANEDMCARYAPGDAECKSYMEIAVSKMRKATPGSFVSMEGSNITYNITETTDLSQPDKVVLLIGKGCGSSCEQFVLEARQSFNVKVIGHNSYGALDYSNLRSYVLPSGRRQLVYATSRSGRLPMFPIDNVGIAPDIYLPIPEDDKAREKEILKVREWLEKRYFTLSNESKR